jgi:hypothetical protein
VFYILKTEAAGFYNMLVTRYQTIGHHIAGHNTIHMYHHANLQLHKIILFNIVHTAHHVLHYHFIHQLSFNTLCFFTPILVLSATLCGVC